MIAKLNKKDISSEHLFHVDVEEQEADEEPGGILDLFRPRKQLIKTIVLWFAW